MAEKTEKREASVAAAAAAPAAPAAAQGDGKKAGGGLLKSTPALLAVVMVVEAAALIAGLKLLGGQPKPAHGADLVTDKGADGHGAAGGRSDKKKTVELSILDFKAPNKQAGRTFLYDVSIYAVARGEHEERIKAMIKEREASIKHHIRTIIAQSDPEKLGGGSEPGLETLRRQVKTLLDELIGEGMIDEVLVPRCIPYRADY